MPENASKLNKLIIDLIKSRYAKPFEREELFHEEEIEEIENIIDKIKETYGSYDERYNTKIQFHENVFVQGERGSGKTSFIFSLQEYLKDKDIYFLPPIDPTNLEHIEPFLIRIVSLINSEVKNSEEWKRIKNEDPYKMESYSKKLSKVAQNARVLLKDAYLRELIETPEIFAAEIIESARSGETLFNDFYGFVSSALNILGKKYFLLRIDDIDMDFTKGFEILETIRKYLSNNRIITILTGDFKLYEDLVRRTFSIRLRNILDLEAKMDELTMKYLDKILPVYNRVNLVSLTQKIYAYKEYGRKYNLKNIKIKYGRDNDNKDRKEEEEKNKNMFQLFNSFFEYFYGESNNFSENNIISDGNPFRSIIPDNTRHFIAFLDYLARFKDLNDNDKKKMDKLIAIMSPVINMVDKERRIIRGNNLMIENLVELSDVYADVWKFYPLRREEDFDRFISLLNALVTEKVLNPDRIMLIFNGMIFTNYVYQEIVRDELLKPSTPEHRKKDIKIYLKQRIKTYITADNATDLYAYLSSYYINDVVNDRFVPGIVRLQRERRSATIKGSNNRNINIANTQLYFWYVAKNKKYAEKAGNYDWLNSLWDEVNDKSITQKSSMGTLLFPGKVQWENRVDGFAKLLLGIFEVPYKKSGKTGKYSFLNVFKGFAAIEMVVKKALEYMEQRDGYDNFKNILSFMSEPEAVSVIDFVDKNNTNPSKDEEEEIEGQSSTSRNTEINDDKSKKLLESLVLWKELYDSKEMKLPPLVFAEAFERFFANLGNMAEKWKSDYYRVTAGVVLEKWVLSFFQWLFISEVKYRSGKLIDAHDIVFGHGVFSRNEVFFNASDNSCRIPQRAQFTRWLMLNPIYLTYINKKTRQRIIEASYTCLNSIVDESRKHKLSNLKNYLEDQYFYSVEVKDDNIRLKVSVDSHDALCGLVLANPQNIKNRVEKFELSDKEILKDPVKLAKRILGR